MQLRLSFDDPLHPRLSPPSLIFVRHPRARRYILRVLPDGSARVTIPRRGSRKEAERFVNTQQRWIEQQRLRRLELLARPSAAPIDRSTILFRGEPVAIDARIDAAAHAATNAATNGNGVTHHASAASARANGHTAPFVLFDGQRLTLRSSTEDPRRRVARYLREVAANELPPRLLELAAQHDLTVGRVSVRDQRTRWGSCSSAGRISLNWRLVQMPDAVRDYVLLHELMHLREPNHSRRFWRHVAAVCPDFQQSRRWLRTHESLLALRDKD